MKLNLLVACSLITPLTYAMDENPNVVKTVEERGIHLTLKPAKVPTITIEQCAQCSNYATHRCSSCHVVYYCSPICQTIDWETHQKNCFKFQSDIEYLRREFSAFIEKALATGNQKYIEQAMEFHLQTLMRATQDQACAHDETISLDAINYKDFQQLEQLVKSTTTTRDTLNTLREQAVPAAFAKVRQLTTQNKLVAPYGIRRYGLQAFQHAKRQSSEFIPKEQWQARRLAVLDEKEEQFRQAQLKKNNPSQTEQE